MGAVRLESDAFAKAPIAACIIAVVEHLQFPAHRDQGPDVHFPFKF